MSRRHRILALVVSAVVAPAPLHPQAPSGAPPAETRPPAAAHWCFRGRPKPTCDVFWLTEFGIAARLSDNRAYSSGPLYTWELGWMLNRGGRSALGVAAFAQVGDGVAAAGIRPRLRAWLSSKTSLDFAPGIVVYGGAGRAPGLSGHVAVNLADYAALSAHVVAMRPEPFEPDRRTRVTTFAGGRLGSAPGSVVGVAFPVVVIVAVLIACSNGRCFD